MKLSYLSSANNFDLSSYFSFCLIRDASWWYSRLAEYKNKISRASFCLYTMNN